MATAKLKRKPRLSKFESYKAANILKKCSFASSFVSLLMGTYPAAAARRNKLINGNEAMGQWAATWRG